MNTRFALDATILLASTAAAQEAAAPLPQPTADGSSSSATEKKKAEIKALIEARDKEAKEFVDAMSIKTWLGVGQTVGASVTTLGAGMVVASYMSTNSGLASLGGYGCIACSSVTTLGFLIAGFFFPNATTEAGQVDAAQKKIDEAAMAF